MPRRTPILFLANNQYPFAIVIFSVFSFLCSLLLPSQGIAATNAKGVEIAFILEGELNQQPAPRSVTSMSVATSPVISHPSATQHSNIWTRIQLGYGIPNMVPERSARFEDFYAQHPKDIANMMARSEKYLHYVVQEVEKRGMPTEIALLPMIESGYNPQALSRSQAAGLWQFVPATGKYFGLEQNWWQDHRKDIIEATQAALDYLEKLHNMFDSWDLALAAYNAGEGTVSRAIASNEGAGLPTNYANLKLPKETTEYVPKLQAIENIVTSPEQYGLKIAPIPNQPYFTEITPPQQIDAKVAAKLAEISDAEFAALNPSYKRPVIASKYDAHSILLPIPAVYTFKNNLATYDRLLSNWTVYQANRGEKLASIARQFNISLSQFRRVNSLPNSKRLSKSLQLLVPGHHASGRKLNIAQLERQTMRVKRTKTRHVRHKIKRGETLSAVAKHYGTSTKNIIKINRLESSKIRAGQIIKVNSKRPRAKTKRM